MKELQLTEIQKLVWTYVFIIQKKWLEIWVKKDKINNLKIYDDCVRISFYEIDNVILNKDNKVFLDLSSASEFALSLIDETFKKQKKTLENLLEKIKLS